MILGGTGMGKSTFLTSLCYNYMNKYSAKTLPYSIDIVYLGNQHFFENFKSREDSNQINSILILDALDENLEAIRNKSLFIKKLENVTNNYKIVIITCRTQFFESEQDEPWRVSVNQNGKPLKYTKLFLSPFSDNDVKKYIENKWAPGGKEHDKYCAALKISDKIKDLEARPLILSYIENLIGIDFGIDPTPAKIYDAIISSVIERERDLEGNTVTDELYYKFYKSLADRIYDEKEENGFMISRVKFDSFINEDEEFYKNRKMLEKRSLIDRTESGLIKFSHKSFLEYFLAINAVESPWIQYEEGLLSMSKTFAMDINNSLLHKKYDEIYRNSNKEAFKYVNAKSKKIYSITAHYQTINKIIEDCIKSVQEAQEDKSIEDLFYGSINQIWFELVKPLCFSLTLPAKINTSIIRVC